MNKQDTDSLFITLSHVDRSFRLGDELVHGLDDPGEVWQVLAPELVKHGLDVFLLHYPNDQPVAESAQFFFQELKELESPRQAAPVRPAVAYASQTMSGPRR